ncbi:Asp/Glu racemase, partial [Alphaproteobacteria bacterium]|nr:Asp/Glu racemase [Alphaproteobacteria bacterium]
MNPQDQTTMIDKLAFETDDGLGAAARLGVIVLQTDQTIEHEFARLLTAKEVALYHARIPNAVEVSTDTLGQMKADLPATAKLLPPSFSFDTIGYACTSGATMIGEDTVAGIIQELHPQTKISNPLSACKAGLAALGVRQLALVTPYPPEVTLAMRDNLKKAGFDATIVASFNQSDDFTVA